MTRVKLTYRANDNSGYEKIVYAVRNEKTGAVGCAQFERKPDGTIFGGDRFYHRPDPNGQQCDYVAGGRCECDGAFYPVGRLPEAERWKLAASMAGID